jgi:hypothetical protein
VFHLYNKLADISVYINNPTPFHLFGLSETRLSSYVSDAAISIPNFSVIRRDPLSPGQTGIAVYIHNSIQHLVHRRVDLETMDVECVWVEVKCPKSKPVLVGFLYRNPASSFEWYDRFSQNLDRALKKKADILLLGDFNIDLLKPHPAWDTTSSLFGLVQLVKSPTRITPTTSTLIDHIYTNKPKAVSDVGVSNLSVSDHYPVVCSWSSKLPKPKKNDHTTITYRTFKHFSKDEFLFDLENTPFNDVLLSYDPNTALSIWYSLFLKVLNKHAPLRERRVKSNTLPPWLTPEIMQAMALRNDLRSNNMFTAYKQQRNRVKYMIREARKKLVRDTVKDSKDTSTIWRLLNTFTRGSPSTATIIPNNLTADTFNDHFLSVAESLISSSKNNTYHCSDLLSEFCQQKTRGTAPFNIPMLAVHEVGLLISNLPNKKSSGPDDISPKILKLSLPYIVESLTYIYNLSIQHSTFPNELKDAKVIPLPKTKDRSDPNNYRPISLLSVLSKPLERHVHKHLLAYLENRKLLHPFQSGFRPQHSCHTALTRLVDTWLEGMNKSQLTGVVYLDFKKAFDLIDHTILTAKLHKYLNNRDAVAFFTSYLTKRKQKVLVHGSYSSLKDVSFGVPQGSVLGPLLFCLFINDLPLHITCQDVKCDLFADDTSVHTTSKDIQVISDNLQQSLNEVSAWCINNSMVVHPVKTKSMVIATRQKQQITPLLLNLSLKGSQIPGKQTSRTRDYNRQSAKMASSYRRFIQNSSKKSLHVIKT